MVPIYLDGTGSILPKGKNWPKRARCAVVFGHPMTIDEAENPRDFAKKVEQRVAELADEFGSGWWQARKNAYRNATPEPTGPEAGAWRRRWALGPKPRPAPLVVNQQAPLAGVVGGHAAGRADLWSISCHYNRKSTKRRLSPAGEVEPAQHRQQPRDPSA